MIFTPDGIKKQEFKNSFRGFDKEEVHAFLDKLSTEFESLFNGNEALKTELEEVKQKLENYLKVENKLKETLAETESQSNKIIEDAKLKAGDILSLAEEKSTELLKKSREEADRLKSAVINLRDEKEILVTKLKTIVNYQAHLLEMKIEEAGEEIKESRKPKPSSGVDVDVNDIVQKLL